MALNGRVSKLEAELNAAAARESTLQAELETARAAAADHVRRVEEGPTELVVEQETEPTVPERDLLEPARASVLRTLITSAVTPRLTSTQVPVIPEPATPLRIPQAAWILSESLIAWAGAWPPTQLSLAADGLQQSIIQNAASGGLTAQV